MGDVNVADLSMEEIQTLFGKLRRRWMAVKMEEAEHDDGGDTKQIKLNYLEAKQKLAGLQAEKGVLEAELAKYEDKKRMHARTMKNDVDALIAVTQTEYERKQRYYDTDPLKCCEILDKFCTEREAELQELYKQIEIAEKEDQECKERLGELRQHAANTIPGIIESKDRELRAIEGAWRLERTKLQSYHKELVDKQAELSWHLNRGSYIKQTPVDPRKQGQFGLKGKVEVEENRLKIWEERLCREYLEWKDKVDDYKLQKIEVAHQYETIRSDFEDRLSLDGKKGKPGSRPDLEDRIAMLKTQLVRENKSCKDLVNENAELKILKKQMEDEIREQRRYGQQLIATQQRATLMTKDEKPALKDRPRAQPLQIMEGSILGKKRFDPR